EAQAACEFDGRCPGMTVSGRSPSASAIRRDSRSVWPAPVLVPEAGFAKAGDAGLALFAIASPAVLSATTRSGPNTAGEVGQAKAAGRRHRRPSHSTNRWSDARPPPRRRRRENRPCRGYLSEVNIHLQE